jgi:asparagine synthetase B (glutamine-hydrolysing)
MAWGLEARVPFLDKAFLEVSMNVNPSEKMFSKGASQEVDEDGLPKMEKVRNSQLELALFVHLIVAILSIS